MITDLKRLLVELRAQEKVCGDFQSLLIFGNGTVHAVYRHCPLTWSSLEDLDRWLNAVKPLERRP